VSRIFSHKLWGAALLIPLKEHYDIHLFEASVHRLIIASEKKANHPEFRQAYPSRLR